MNTVALIPARSGSKRVIHKNIKLLMGHPLMAYAISSALESGAFSGVYVSTDSKEYADIAIDYGAKVVMCQTPTAHQDTTPDIAWVRHALERIPESQAFSILRVTSPFRSAETIRRAMCTFQDAQDAGYVDSLRAVEPVSQHPGKAWVLRGGLLHPILPYSTDDAPWHSNQYQALPQMYAQNASLEIAHRYVVERGTISGERIVPFFTEGYEGWDINTVEDWFLTELLIEKGLATLPEVTSGVTA